MRTYNIFLCPRCKAFEYRGAPFNKWICKARKKEEGIQIDPAKVTSITEPPPECRDFILEGRK